jgi:predicted Zn-dependent protease
MQPIDTVTLAQIIEELQSRGVKVELKPAILRARDSYDARRQQFRAERLLEHVTLAAERPVLGLTDGDCYAAKLNFVFGMAEVGGGTAVVSLFRLRAGATAGTFMTRTMKEIFHELGHAVGLGTVATERAYVIVTIFPVAGSGSLRCEGFPLSECS